MFCSRCGAELKEGNKFCTNCGSVVAGGPVQGGRFQQEPPKKSSIKNWEFADDKPYDPNLVTPDKCRVSPGVAAVMSALLIGLGQMLNGQLVKGVIILTLGMIISALTGGAAVPGIWVLSSIDAYQCAKKLYRGESIGRFSFF